MPVIDCDKLIQDRVNAIRNLHTMSGMGRAELDVSGGVDSAVMLGLLVRALGASKVTAVYQGISSSPDSLKRAREAAAAFGVSLVEFDGTEIFEQFIDQMVGALQKAGFSGAEISDRVNHDPTIMGSIRSTMRAPWGRAANRLTGGGIRHGTGNEDEDRYLRFYQKGGDGEVDTNPIAMLAKGEVFQLARALGVPHSILTARPSPDLWGVGEAHNDEDEIRAYLGLPADTGLHMYSYVSPDTGGYISVGLIERFSRWLDQNPEFFSDPFAPLGDVSCLAVPPELQVSVCSAMRRVELMTRHKLNPAIPSLGSRQNLLAEGILTNDLPGV